MISWSNHSLLSAKISGLRKQKKIPISLKGFNSSLCKKYTDFSAGGQNPNRTINLAKIYSFHKCKIRLVKSKHKTIPKKVRLYASKILLQLYQKPNDEFEPQLVGMEHELLQTDQIILMTSAAFMLL